MHALLRRTHFSNTQRPIQHLHLDRYFLHASVPSIQSGIHMQYCIHDNPIEVFRLAFCQWEEYHSLRVVLCQTLTGVLSK